jgi:hypothetical protein
MSGLNDINILLDIFKATIPADNTTTTVIDVTVIQERHLNVSIFIVNWSVRVVRLSAVSIFFVFVLMAFSPLSDRVVRWWDLGVVTTVNANGVRVGCE